MENMRVPKLKAFTRGHRLRGYTRIRSTELIELIRKAQWNTKRLFKVGSLVLYPSNPIDLCHLHQLDLHQLHQLNLHQLYQLKLGTPGRSRALQANGNCGPKPDNLRGLWSPAGRASHAVHRIRSSFNEKTT